MTSPFDQDAAISDAAVLMHAERINHAVALLLTSANISPKLYAEVRATYAAAVIRRSPIELVARAYDRLDGKL